MLRAEMSHTETLSLACLAFPARLGQADGEKKQDAADLPTPITSVAILSPFAGLFSLGANGLSAERVLSGPCCDSGAFGLGSLKSLGLWQRHRAMWLLPPCRQRAGCEASCGT